MYGSYAKRAWAPEYPWAPTPEERIVFFESIKKDWGGVVDLEILAPSAIHDERFKHWWATYLRRSASPADALALAKMNTNIDIRDILSAIHVPTLILHRRGDLDIDVEGSRYMASRIEGAKFIELAGDDHLPWVGDQDKILDEIEIFLTGELKQPDNERILATVLFIDIVNSTELISEMGDTQWKYLLQSFQNTVRKELDRFRGREIDTAGDGFLSIFDGPARAIRCAVAIIINMNDMGLQLRAGVHTGECEMIENRVGGIAVHTGARVMGHARPGEVFVSGTVKDLVSGSGIHFRNEGKFILKGIPGESELYSVTRE
jgi:class 3 adenylate cyclase